MGQEFKWIIKDVRIRVLLIDKRIQEAYQLAYAVSAPSSL